MLPHSQWNLGDFPNFEKKNPNLQKKKKKKKKKIFFFFLVTIVKKKTHTHNFVLVTIVTIHGPRHTLRAHTVTW